MAQRDSGSRRRGTGDTTGSPHRTARTRATKALRDHAAHQAAILELALDAIIIVDHAGRITEFNPAAERLFGYSRAEALGQEISRLIVPPERRARHDAGREEYQRTGHGPMLGRYVEGQAMRRDGSVFPVEVATVRIPGIDPPAFVGYLRDITQRKQSEEVLRYQALHDALTGLPNRTLLHDRLDQAIRAAAREQTSLTLLQIDLDRFKEVNDTLGHAAGDALLQQLGRRLQDAIRASDTVARLGGDEFAVLLPASDTTGAIQTARALLHALGEPLSLAGHMLFVGASIGIATYPMHGADAASLLRQADVAMYTAKRAGGGYAVYARTQDAHTPERLSLTSALHHAIVHDELRLHYQPTVDVVTGHVRTVEALVRWQRPEHGLLLPDQFIPLAEETGLIVPLTRWVLETALQQCRRWQQAGLDLSVAVNLSVRTLYDPDLTEMITELLQTYDVQPDRLRIELTESMVMTDPARALEVLTHLHARGIRLAIDDFGTGYSSLAYLKRLPVDEIKIDRSFVLNMVADADDATIVASTLGLGHSLGLRFVAEGVETGEVWDMLAALGV